MALEDGEFALSGDVPKPDRAVVASARQQIALRRKVERAYPFRVSGEDSAPADSREVIKLDRAILPTCDKTLFLSQAMYASGQNLVIRLGDGANHPARGHIPEFHRLSINERPKQFAIGCIAEILNPPLGESGD